MQRCGDVYIIDVVTNEGELYHFDNLKSLSQFIKIAIDAYMVYNIRFKIITQTCMENLKLLDKDSIKLFYECYEEEL